MILTIIENYWDALVMMMAEMAPYLLLGFFILFDSAPWVHIRILQMLYNNLERYSQYIIIIT